LGITSLDQQVSGIAAL